MPTADIHSVGDRMSRVIAQALQMGESNACMKRIVAAPTAGACGVLPAVLIPLFEETKQDCTSSAPAAEASVLTEDDFVLSLFVAAGIGQVIATRASIAGASRRLSGRDRICFRNGGPVHSSFCAAAAAMQSYSLLP